MYATQLTREKKIQQTRICTDHHGICNSSLNTQIHVRTIVEDLNAVNKQLEIDYCNPEPKKKLR